MGDYAKGVPATLLGKPYEINNDIPDIGAGARSVAFGDFQKGYRARYVNSISIKRLEEIYAESDEVGFVSFMSIDGKVFDSNAIKLLKHP
jgi:HK97 family phage major capsid protein